MSYRNKSYVIFDGDNDIWAYGFMNGWKENEHVDFDFNDAHDIGGIRNDSEEETVKGHLRERFANSAQVIVLIGDHTKNKYKYVRWEIEVAQGLDLPIIAVNLNDLRIMDPDRCPAILTGTFTVHIPFKMKIIQYALDNFPGEYHKRDTDAGGDRVYNESVYKQLGL